MTVTLTQDAAGHANLILRGAWSPDMESAVSRESFELISLFGTDWTDYEPLSNFRERIRWLRVPFGPDSSRGLDRLTELQRLELLDLPKPPVDFRLFPKLSHLEAIWPTKRAEFLSNPALRTLKASNTGGEGLSWIPEDARLSTLELKSGTVSSLSGLENAPELSFFRASGLKKCLDVSAIGFLTTARAVDLDAPNAHVRDLDFLGGLRALECLTLSSVVDRLDWDVVASCRSLRRFGVRSNAVATVSDKELENLFARHSRTVERIERLPSVVPSIIIEFEV